MAEKKAAGATKGPKKTKDVVIHLPDTEELAAAKLSQAEIEKLVVDTVGGAKEPAKRARLGKVPGVTVKSGATVARALNLQAPTVPTWIKTIWRRVC